MKSIDRHTLKQHVERWDAMKNPYSIYDLLPSANKAPFHTVDFVSLANYCLQPKPRWNEDRFTFLALAICLHSTLSCSSA
jgi:hypothetical protein